MRTNRLQPPEVDRQIPRTALKISEAAVSMGISRAGVYNLIKAGLLRPTPIGGRRVITLAELERFLREQGETDGEGPKGEYGLGIGVGRIDKGRS